jgi:hypothetical protein
VTCHRNILSSLGKEIEMEATTYSRYVVRSEAGKPLWFTSWYSEQDSKGTRFANMAKNAEKAAAKHRRPYEVEKVVR